MTALSPNLLTAALQHQLARSPRNTHLTYEHRRRALPKHLAGTHCFCYLCNYFQTFTSALYQFFACCVIKVCLHACVW